MIIIIIKTFFHVSRYRRKHEEARGQSRFSNALKRCRRRRVGENQEIFVNTDSAKDVVCLKARCVLLFLFLF